MVVGFGEGCLLHAVYTMAVVAVEVDFAKESMAAKNEMHVTAVEETADVDVDAGSDDADADALGWAPASHQGPLSSS